MLRPYFWSQCPNKVQDCCQMSNSGFPMMIVGSGRVVVIALKPKIIIDFTS